MWHRIDDPDNPPPKDGALIIAGKKSDWITGFVYVAYPVTSKFINGKWCANFGSKENERWEPYEPQPTLWRLPPPPAEDTP